MKLSEMELPEMTCRTYGGYDVFISHHIRKEVIGYTIIWAHPLIQWFAKYFPIRPYTIGEPIEIDSAIFIGNKMYVSPAMYQTLKREHTDWGNAS